MPHNSNVLHVIIQNEKEVEKGYFNYQKDVSKH